MVSSVLRGCVNVEGGCLFVGWESRLFVSVTNAMPSDRRLRFHSHRESEKSWMSAAKRRKNGLEGETVID